MPPNWFPNPFTLGNFRMVMRDPMLPHWFLNSVIVAGAITIGRVFVCSLAGYVFAKLRFVGREVLFSLILAIMLIPGQLTLIPLYMIVVRFGWLNSFTGLIVPDLISPFGVFMMRQFFRTIPTEMLESAQIDGCSAFSTYRHIILPLAKPGLAVLSIFSFIGAWNDFLWPLIILNKQSLYTIQLGLARIQMGYTGGYMAPPGLAMASALLAALPCFFIFFAFQRYFLEGLTLGALKG
jgi:multiple sugar transport system permease protein